MEDSLYLSHSVSAMPPIVLITLPKCNLFSASASFVQYSQALKDVYIAFANQKRDGEYTV